MTVLIVVYDFDGQPKVPTAMTCRNENLSVTRDADYWAACQRVPHNQPGTGCTFGEQVPWEAPLSDTALTIAGFVGGLALMLLVYLVVHFFRNEIRKVLSK